MTPLAFLSLAGFLVSIYISDFVYYKNPRAPINRAFLALGVSNAVLLIAEFGGRLAGNAYDAMVWKYVDAFWPFRMMVFVIFIMIFTGRWGGFRQDRKKHTALFLLAAAFFVIYLSGLATATVEKDEWGWETVFGGDALGTTADIVNGIIPPLFIFPSIALGFAYYLRQKEPRKRKQAAYVMAGISIPAILSVLTDAVAPSIFSISLPETDSIFAFSGIFIAYGIWKYELMVLSPEKVAAEIVQTMPDPLLLLDGEGNINTVSPSASALLGYRKGELEGKSVSSVLPPEFKDYKKILGEYADGAKDVSAEVLTGKGEKIPVSVSFSTTRYDKKNVKSTVIIFRDNREREKAKQEIVKKTGELEKKTLEFEKANQELKRINDLAIGRELKMVELKKKIAEIERK